MCGRYSLRRVDIARLHLGAAPESGYEPFDERPVPRFNVAPSQAIPVVRLDRAGRRVMGPVRWGLIPHWAKGTPTSKPINARAETVATSPMFRHAFARRRCLVPADGFYEWQRRPDGGKRPMFVHFPDDRPFAFAGVWERWRPAPDAAPVDTCAIVTTAPNRLMAPIHDRMPVIVRPGDYATWLDPGADPGAAGALMRPYDDGELEAVPVERTVNSPRNDGPECVKPLAEP